MDDRNPPYKDRKNKKKKSSWEYQQALMYAIPLLIVTTTNTLLIKWSCAKHLEHAMEAHFNVSFFSFGWWIHTRA